MPHAMVVGTGSARGARTRGRASDRFTARVARRVKPVADRGAHVRRPARDAPGGQRCLRRSCGARPGGGGGERGEETRPNRAARGVGVWRPRPERACRQSPAGEMARTVAAPPALASSSATQPPSELPATCGRSRPEVGAQGPPPLWPAQPGVGINADGQSGRIAEPGKVDGDDVALGRQPVDHRLPDPTRPAEAVDQDERVAASSSGGKRSPSASAGLPSVLSQQLSARRRIRCSRNPASEEAR